jgi:hypothetical protein
MMFNFGKILRDLVAKGMMVLGGSTAVTGIATAEEWTAISGGVAALVGLVIQGFNKRKELKEVAVVATAVDEKKTTAEVIAAVDSGVKTLPPVGAAVAPPTVTSSGKKNFSSR